ncbi:hypothetical protein VCHA53O466_70280 [Vibrio chagasii]|nr:hypothetical protein VCHA53O466_70280 [Vibrio chagasii]
MLILKKEPLSLAALISVISRFLFHGYSSRYQYDFRLVLLLPFISNERLLLKSSQ